MLFDNPEYIVKGKNSRFRHQLHILCWKSYLQRMRRWRIHLAETVLALILFIVALWSSSSVFLTLLQPEPARPQTMENIKAAIPKNTIIGYAPEDQIYETVMEKVAKILNTDTIHAPSRQKLNELLYNTNNGTQTDIRVIWVIWEPKEGNVWRFSVLSNERAKFLTNDSEKESPLLGNPHILSGFLAVQIAVSHAIVEVSSTMEVNYNLLVAAMPVSPLMKEQNVRNAVSLLLACVTLALLPPVMETEALVVKETITGFKRALRMYEVDYSTMYLGWLFFAGLTITPICILAAITLTLIFRWIHIFVAMLIIMAYTYVMILMSMIMAIFHEKVAIAWAWTGLFTITQVMLAELLIHHRYDQFNEVLTAILNTLIPPMGLIHGLNQFAMVQAGGHGNESGLTTTKIVKMIVVWILMIVFYFLILMLFQRTHENAIGGRVHWKTIIFKKKRDKQQLRSVDQQSRTEEVEQEVDELVPKAIIFENVSKSILNETILTDVWMNIYRNEFSMVFTQRYQLKMIRVMEDLILKLTEPDHGTITILGNNLCDEFNPMTGMYGMGYCHEPEFLIDELTVLETLQVLIDLCLWRESKRFVWEYTYLRTKHLLRECKLQKLKHQRIRDLGVYYKTLLCWAIAMLLEPRIVVVSQILNNPRSVAVIIDKMMKYRKYMALLYFSDTYIKMEYVDRLFLLDHRILIFAGTPAYMFYKFGRDYRIRLTFTHDIEESKKLKAIGKVFEVGAEIRCYFGSLLIMKMPASPPERVAGFIQHLEHNKEEYGIFSINVAVPDPDEVYKRAIYESSTVDRSIDNIDLAKVEEQSQRLPTWQRKWSSFNQFQMIGLKFWTFYKINKRVLFITVLSAIFTGGCFGWNMSKPLMLLDKDLVANNIVGRELLTVEAQSHKINLIMRIANDTTCLAIANAYVLSTTGANQSDVNKLSYTCIASRKSLSEYLITRVIDSPQVYVYKYAYGLNLRKFGDESLRVKVLYNPFHMDRAAAARSTSRTYMALLRYYSGNMDADIQVIDHPIGLDRSQWVKYNTPPPLLVHLLLVYTIAHVIIIPSKEHGFIKYNQMHAMGFSPLKYWSYLLFYDVLLYFILVLLVTISMLSLFFLLVPMNYTDVTQLLMITLLLFIYGLTCIPQAYLFTLFGSRSILNSMLYVILNIVFGEATIVFKYLYGGINQVNFMIVSPQYNMAFALLKVNLIFFSNNECRIMEAHNKCKSLSFHKCCQYCGVIQPCHSRMHYFSFEHGVIKEIITIIFGAIFFWALLMFIEHKLFRTIVFQIRSRYRKKLKKPHTLDSVTDDIKLGAAEEEIRVIEKIAQLEDKSSVSNPFGEYLLADHVTNVIGDVYEVRKACLGLGRGDALALTGRINHGRQALCNILAGYKRPSQGNVISMAKWKLMTNHHQFCRQVSYCCFRSPLPPWMPVYVALRMLAALRGVPPGRVKEELHVLLTLMDMQSEKRTLVANISKRLKARLHVIAAVLGAPPVLVLDELMAFQKFYVKRAVFYILNELKRRGHGLIISSADVESQLPVSNRMAILLDGYIFDVGNMSLLKERYGMKGYTVVVHLKDEVDAVELFRKYFAHFVVNDISGVLINCQVLDIELDIAMVFERMECLRIENTEVYSYIVTMVPLANLYNKIIKNEVGYMHVHTEDRKTYKTKLGLSKQILVPQRKDLQQLRKMEPKFFLTNLKDLPWSVIFKR